MTEYNIFRGGIDRKITSILKNIDLVTSNVGEHLRAVEEVLLKSDIAMVLVDLNAKVDPDNNLFGPAVGEDARGRFLPL